MYGFDLYGSEVDVLLPSTGLSQRAIVRRLTHDGRSPHAPARHNVVHAQRIFKGRRIYESDDANEQAGAWARAPVMTRTNEGFFKRIDTYRDGDVPTRKWQGFAGEDGFATVTDLELDGATLSLRRVNDAGRGTPRRPGPQQYAGEWVTIDDVSTLDMESFASQGDVLVTVYVERERDGQRVPFAYFNGRQKQRWQLIPDPTERYRIVIENVDEDLGFVTDLEISHEAGDLGRYADADDQLLDLRRIGLGMSATSAATLEVWPQPARDVVTMLARCSMTTTPAVLTIRDVRGEGVMRLPCKSIDLIRIPTSTMPTGSYMATIEAEGRVIGRTMFQIIR